MVAMVETGFEVEHGSDAAEVTVTLLALFDVCAAFDTVDHDILINRLLVSFGISGKPLDWLHFFFSEWAYVLRCLWVH